MNIVYRDWRDYQEAVGAFFRQLGCTVGVEVRVQGVRASHAVDVFVTFRQFGIECRWVVECKLWTRRVEKADVLTLKSVLEDVGADRGIIFCENDFQAGARDAARHTNILLVTSLKDFRRTVQLGDARARLILQESIQSGAAPIYVLPSDNRPQNLLLHGGRLFVANWNPGNIVIVDPVTRTIESVIDLDKYEVAPRAAEDRALRRYPPGDMACADGKLFVGQVASEFVLVIDIATKSIIKRIVMPGGGEGAIAASPDGSEVYFASNRANRLFIIDSATYEYQTIEFPSGGRGSMCVLRHPSRPLIYIGVQRGGTLDGRSLPGGNCFLATYDLAEGRYVANLYLAEVENDRSDDATPCSLTFDPDEACLYVGMFQSRRGICRVDESGNRIEACFRFTPNSHNNHFAWVDPLSQALYADKLLSVNRNNCELVTLDKRSGAIKSAVFLGVAPNGPKAVVVSGDEAIVSYPERGGLIFLPLKGS